MKLLFDHNLSPRLVQRLVDLFPASSHVYLVGLDRAPDSVLWDYSQANGYAIVTKDADLGSPPQAMEL
jgi:predicted nuclease of predicted toxin-antitoxin system